jgi:two-component system LytT family response regulator
MLRAIIIDDEASSINALKVLIERHTPDVKVVAATTEAANGISLVSDYRPDIVFLDVSMPEMNGFEFLDKLGNRDFRLVFITAHQEYALQAIKNKADDYLLKPIDIQELKTCVGNILARNAGVTPTAKGPAPRIVELSVKDGIIFIRPDDIIRLEASGSYTTFYLENGIRHLASKNLKECEGLLSSQQFFRCHPSHLVNLRKVERIVSTDGLFIKMSDGSMPELARKNKDPLLEKLKSI